MLFRSEPPDVEADQRRGAGHESRATRLVGIFPLWQLLGGASEGETSWGRAAENPPAKAAQGGDLERRVKALSEPRAVRAVWTLQTANGSGLENRACLNVKSIGKPCAGKSHARFDEGGQAEPALYSTAKRITVRSSRTSTQGIPRNLLQPHSKAGATRLSVTCRFHVAIQFNADSRLTRWTLRFATDLIWVKERDFAADLTVTTDGNPNSIGIVVQ